MEAHPTFNSNSNSIAAAISSEISTKGWDASRLTRLLNPESIAFVGGAFAQEAIRQCVKMGYQGEIWPVHPSLTEIEGYPVYRQIADLPAAPDACYIAVNRELTVGIVAELAARGAGGAVCYASGFREIVNNQHDDTTEADLSGVLLEQKLLAASGDMPFFGPNCYGFINYLDGVILWPDQHGGKHLAADEKGVAIITQSSNLSINLTMQQRGLPLAYMLTAGNQSKVGLSDMALALIEDQRVTALGLHVEGFDDIRQFERLAQRSRELQKPVVMMKVGRSEQAQNNTLSHTASLAGSHKIAEAFAQRLGFATVSQIGDFVETLKCLHHSGGLQSYALNAMVCSGGEASIMADTAVGRKVHFPSLPSATTQRLQQVLGPLVSVSNPLDFHTYIWNDVEKMSDVFEAMLQPQITANFGLSVFIIDFPRADRCDSSAWYPPLEAMMIAIQRFEALHGVLPKVAITASLPENLSEAVIAEITSRYPVMTFGSFAETLGAAEKAVDIVATWKKPLPEPLCLPETMSMKPVEKPQVLEESDAKQALQTYGLTIPPQRIAMSAEQAVEYSEELGYPVVCKARSIAHKTEHNAVRLNLYDAASVGSAVEELLTISDSVLVESMITAPFATPVGELIVGVTQSAPFGPVMTIGAGGIMVELLQDSVSLLLPSSEASIREALASLTLAKCFGGFRGKPAWDIDAVVQAIKAVQSWVLDHQAELLELDINPLLVCEKGAYAADALIVMSAADSAKN